jgi:hypothetical protein
MTSNTSRIKITYILLSYTIQKIVRKNNKLIKWKEIFKTKFEEKLFSN